MEIESKPGHRRGPSRAKRRVHQTAAYLTFNYDFGNFCYDRKFGRIMKLSPAVEKYVLHWGEMGTRWGTYRTVAQIQA